LIAADSKTCLFKSFAESRECRADLYSPFGSHSFFQDRPDLSLSAATVMGRSHAEGSMRFFGQIADGDDGHIGSTPGQICAVNDSIFFIMIALTSRKGYAQHRARIIFVYFSNAYDATSIGRDGRAHL
jgi:hypothetical protein